MKKIETILEWWLCVVFMAVCALAPVTAEAQGGGWAIKKKGQTWETVENIEYRASRDSYYVRRVTAGYEVSRDQVDDLKVPKPENFDEYARDLSGVAPSTKAMVGMETIVKNFKMLKWDVDGLTYLVPVYEKQNNLEKIQSACQELEKLGKEVPEALLSAYWGALLKNSPQTLKTAIKKTIESGSRPAAAVAHVKRGDILFDEGNKKKALADGYLRAVILFADVKGIQPEALYKTWRALKALRDRRADKFRRKLLDEYPNSKYAKDVE